MDLIFLSIEMYLNNINNFDDLNMDDLIFHIIDIDIELNYFDMISVCFDIFIICIFFYYY